MTEVQKLQQQIMELSGQLHKLQRDSAPSPVKNYTFSDLNGDVTLLDLFAGKEVLFTVHNMGQGCRYCTTWADGINAFLTHLEDKFSVVLLSKDSPAIQRQFANSRGWRFRMASHGGKEYIREQSVMPGEDNMPGMVCYIRKGNEIFKKNSAVFGPGDLFCSIWHILALGGFGEGNWTPQYSYWKRPEKLDDGGQNLI